MPIKARDLIVAKALGIGGESGGSSGGGVVLPTLTNPATAAEIKKGYEAINGSGKKMTGTHEDITYPTAEEASF